MKPTTVLISVAALLATNIAHAQTQSDLAFWGDLAMPMAITLSGLGVPGEHRAKVIAPLDFPDQAHRGTLRELELEVPPGALHDALARAYRSRARINALTLKTGQGTSPYLVFTMKNAQVTAFQTSSADGGDKYGFAKVHIHGGGSSPPPPGPSGPGDLVQPPKPPAPGIEGSPIGTVGAPQERPQAPTPQLAVADLLPLNGLQIGSKLIPWGQTATIPADQASAKQGGRCQYRYRYDTGNQGNAAAGPATNLVLLNAPNGAELAQDALPGLAVAAQHTSSGNLWLKPGTWTLYVHADGKQDVAEGDEVNNLRRVRVQVEGSCD